MPSILIAFPITTFCLGTWQLYRLKEKTELIKTLNSNLSNDPIDISRPNNSKIGDKVLITGAFLDSQFHVGPRSYPSSPSGSIFSSSVNSHGYFVISPFQMKNGPLILVNRGWIPSDIKESFKNRWSFGELSLKSIFIPKNDPVKGQWYTIDLESMSNIARCSSTPLIELIEPDGSGAIPKKAGIDVANNHLGYAITWFGMSIVSAFLLKKGIVRGNRRFL